ncbi:MAG: CYTH domain-containing protein [Lentisphaeria bacterium]|nr:CYTH domain-containing protein [Lentisphaeria bacterium]
MNLEVERKFLVKDRSVIERAESFDRIEQGYFLSEKGISIRVRLKNQKAFLCIKGRVAIDNGIIRNEFEYEIPYADGEFMLNKFCKERTVKKNRYYLRENNFLWEIDVFADRHEPLIIAEVELPSEKTLLKLPAWVGEEVSDDPKYTNQYLASN